MVLIVLVLGVELKSILKKRIAHESCIEIVISQELFRKKLLQAKLVAFRTFRILWL